MVLMLMVFKFCEECLLYFFFVQVVDIQNDDFSFVKQFKWVIEELVCICGEGFGNYDN